MTAASTVIDLPPAPPHLANDPVLRRAKEGLKKIYGDRLAGVILYGSRARGDSRPDSDYDLLALIKNHSKRADGDAAAKLSTEIFLEGGHVVSFLTLPDDGLAQRTGFMFNVRHEGFML